MANVDREPATGEGDDAASIPARNAGILRRPAERDENAVASMIAARTPDRKSHDVEPWKIVRALMNNNSGDAMFEGNATVKDICDKMLQSRPRHPQTPHGQQQLSPDDSP